MHPGDVDRLNPALRADFIQPVVQAIELARSARNRSSSCSVRR